MRRLSKVLMMLLVCCTVLIFACGTSNNLSDVRAEDTVTRGEWMSILVDTFDMVIEDGVVPDDYYGDISESEYYEDILIAMNFGVIELEAGEDFEPDGVVTREFAAQTLNYCLGFQLDEDAEYTMSDKESLTYAHDAQVAINRGWFALIDGAFSPTTAMTLEEKTDMLADAEAVWASTTVDTTYENTYTFADSVVEVPIGTEVVVSEDGTISIADCPVTINENDTFVVYENELPQSYKALTVAENEGTTTITTEAVEFDTVCKDADAQGEIEADLTQAVPLTEGVTITYEEESSGTEVATYSVSRASKKVKPIKINYNKGGVNINCTIKNIKIEYKTQHGEKYIGVKGKSIINATVTQKKNMTIPLADVPVAGVGRITVLMEYSVTGTVTLTYTTNFVMGVSYTKVDGFRAVKEFSKDTFSYSARVDASAYCRIAMSAGIQGAISGIIYADIGIKGNATYDSYGDGKSPENCLDVSAYVFVRVGYDVSVLKESWDDAYYIYDKNNTPIRVCYHIEDGVGVNSCSRGKTTSSGKRSKYYTSKYSGTSASGSRTTISTYCDSGFTGDDTVKVYEYTTNDEGNATITKYNGCAYSLIIPDEIDGYPVTAIGSNAFKNNAYIRSVVIPDGVTSIGSSAFYQCTNLQTVVMPDSVTEIQGSAFSFCTKLSEVDLPSKLVTIGQAFADCDKIESITIPKSLEKVNSSYGVFYECDGLKEVIFEAEIAKIESGLFAYCTGLEEITIPDTVTTIESRAFYECSNLQKVEIPDSVTEIQGSAFSFCTKLSEVDLPSKLVTIGQAFADCDKIESITIPKSLEKVNSSYGVFYECDGLKEVIFEAEIAKIESGLFAYCTGLEEITIPDTVTTIESSAFFECSNLQKVEILDSVTEIQGSAFYNCVGLQEINIPNSVTSIGSYIFEGCTNLQKVHLPEIRVNLMDGTFQNCTSLTEVNFPDTLETIGSNAFYNCTSLTEVNIPSKVHTINSSAFYGCTGLSKVTIPASMRTIYSSAFSHCEALTDLTIAEGVTTIYENNFEYCKVLEKVTLPDSLQTLGSYAFRYCDALSEVTIGAGLKVIPSYCFYEDPALEKIVLPQQVTTVNSYAFGNCTKFADITMNRNVSTITANAFSYPDKLTIRGISGTYPETFATENEITFVALNTPATAIKLNATEKRLARGYTAQMTANITPADSSDQLTWTSSDEDIVTVDANGQIKGIATGTATIIAMAGDVMEFCEVTVYEKVTN